MSQEIKITEADLSEIRNFQGEFQNAIEQFGILEVERLTLEEKSKALKEHWINLRKRERELMDRILQTYGEGNLNMNTGTITK